MSTRFFSFFKPDRRLWPVSSLFLALLGLFCVWMPLLAWAVQYQMALPGYRYQFPRDHASHPAYKTEWWYYTGHLQTTTGKPYGYELTFFRIGRPPSADTEQKSVGMTTPEPWKTDTLYAAHFALSDEQAKRFYYSEQLNRAGLNTAGARTDVYYVWNELWLAEGLGNQMVLRAETTDGQRELHLLLTPEKPPVIHGRDGVSQKASCRGCASHYYSLTRLKTEGFLREGGKATPVTGLSWMDHEFGSNQLASNQNGWDWFSIQLEDGTDLMLYLLRQDSGHVDPNSSGTVVEANGQTRHLALQSFQVRETGATWRSPQTQGRYPMGWTIQVPASGLRLEVMPTFEAQELATKASTGVAYWEGSATVRGTHAGKPVKGRAYVEMTGYAANQGVKNKF